MALTKQNIVDKIEILRDGVIYIRLAKEVYDDAELVGQVYHREALTPGMDVTKQPKRIRDIAQLLWTQAVIDAYNAKRNG